MDRLSIDEVIEHCKRHTERMESHSGRSQLEETPIGNSNIMKQYWEHRQVAEWLEQLKHYKDAEEQGLLLRLPCKVGDVIYEINNGKIVEHCLRSKWRIARYMEEGIFGVLAFTTREEAEQALEDMKGGAEC